MLSQDNWPNPGNTGVSNFKRFRLQFDFKLDTNTSADIRFYDASRMKDKATLAASDSDAIMDRNDHSRIQANLTHKF